MVRRRYKLEQPMVHAHYRGKFSGVDRWNRFSFGPGSIQNAMKTKSWHVRFFLAMLSACVTNAFLASNW